MSDGNGQVAGIRSIDRVNVGPLQSDDGGFVVGIHMTFANGGRTSGWVSTKAAELLITMLRGSLEAIEKGGPPEDPGV